MIKFEVEIDKSIFRRNRLIIRSTHQVDNGKLINMFSNENAGNPMLDVADAIILREYLNEFIIREIKG